jgi:hypothetical protein
MLNNKTYDFLKKKREETIDKSKFKKPWTKEEVNYFNILKYI